ncbi:MAG: hypothetical protein WC358_04230 [Ignavibacteria bacterium]
MNTLIKKTILFLLLIIAGLNCKLIIDSEVPINTEVYEIQGRVISGIFNSGVPGIKVLYYKNFTYTDNYGLFRMFGNEAHHYDDIYVTDSINKTGSIFLEGNDGWKRLYHTVESIDTNNLPCAYINIILQNGMGNSNRKKIFYTDYFHVHGFSDDGFCKIYLQGNYDVYGKVCVLLYTVDTNEQVISYDKFGFKKCGFLYGKNYDLIFTQEDMNFNPDEILVTGTITNLPPHTSSTPSYLLFSMSPVKSDYIYPVSKICNISGNSFSFLIPKELPERNYYPVLSLNFSDSSIGLTNTNLNYILPTNGNANINIAVPSNAQIIDPPPNTLIDSNTSFTVYSQNTDCIFHISIENASRKFHIYTKSGNFNIQKISKLGLGGLIPNTSVVMKVNTIGLCNSVSQYIYEDFLNISNYTTQEVVRNYYVKP